MRRPLGCPGSASYTGRIEVTGSRAAASSTPFYDGYNALQSDDWEFIVKLDGDLSFSAGVFREML
jgi:hypothetical protein